MMFPLKPPCNYKGLPIAMLNNQMVYIYMCVCVCHSKSPITLFHDIHSFSKRVTHMWGDRMGAVSSKMKRGWDLIGIFNMY